MRILHTEPGLSSGGQEYRTVAEVEWLNANGHQAWIASQRESELFAASGSNPCLVPMKMRGTWDHRATSRLAWLYTRLRCDIIHTHSPVDAWISFPLKLLGVPVIRTRHITNPVGVGFRLYAFLQIRMLPSHRDRGMHKEKFNSG